MELIDTHCHIQSAGGKVGEKSTRDIWAKAGGRNPYDIFKDAQKSDVSTMVCVGCDVEDSWLAINFASHQDNAYASIGIHPHEAAGFMADKKNPHRFSGYATLPKVVAIGECGLDYYYNHSPKEAQIAVLHYQIQLALEHGLPMIFHVREAFDDFWPIFESYKGIRGVLHSFTDSQENMERAISHGLYIGVNGIATFAKNQGQLAMYKAIPLANLVLETDSPFLTPVPYRGKICEPYHIKVIAEFLSELRHQEFQKLAAATTHNAKQLFRII